MKGSKHKWWIKDGEKTSKKMFKKLWNKKIRHKELYDNSHYKMYAGESMMVYIT